MLMLCTCAALAADPAPQSAPQDVAHAAQHAAAQSLSQWLRGWSSLRADFQQHLHDTHGALLRRSSGRLWVQRPGRLRWEIFAPFAELLTGDGTTLWLWDPDLQQVSIRPYDQRLTQTPAQLLLGARVEDLQDDYHIAVEHEQTLSHYRMRPAEADGLLRELQLMLHGNRLHSLVVLDSIGQRTLISFQAVEYDLPMAQDLFRFQIPEGADVLTETGAFPATPGGASAPKTTR